MRSFMGFQAKRELLLQMGARYSEATSQTRATILDEFVLATGYNRKYAIRLLNNPALPLPSFIKRNRARKYTTIHEALAVAWKAANCICAKRLVPFLPELVPGATPFSCKIVNKFKHLLNFTQYTQVFVS